MSAVHLILLLIDEFLLLREIFNCMCMCILCLSCKNVQDFVEVLQDLESCTVRLEYLTVHGDLQSLKERQAVQKQATIAMKQYLSAKPKIH